MQLSNLAILSLTQILGTSVGASTVSPPPLLCQPPDAYQSKVTQGCALPPGWDAVAKRRPRFVVFGEVHGTQQAPEFVGDLACALTSRGERILVAVENSSKNNSDFQKAWQLSEAQFPAELKQAGWVGADDGTHSEAMLALLMRLHRLARQGHSVDMVAFNGTKNEEQARRFADLPGQGPHEAAQADNIRLAAAARPYDRVLVLVGDVHARKRPAQWSGGIFEPMAMQLAPPADVVTLKMETAGGTAWNCQMKPGVKPEPNKPITSDAIACDSYPLGTNRDLQREPFISLAALPGAEPDPAYDGIFWLGRVSASPPAVR